MATLCSRNGSLESGNTGTYHHNLLALTCRSNFHALYLTAYQRIDGTTASEGHRALCHAGIATQAFHDAVFLTCHNFLWVEWIGKQLTAHIYNIRLTLCNDTFHLLRIA